MENQAVNSICLTIKGDIAPGIQRMSLNAKLLYPDREQLYRFEARLREFLEVDTSSNVISYQDEVISYLTESVIPAKLDSRPPMLLLFGNPTPESVEHKCFFSGEKNRGEHRFWRALRESGIMTFDEGASDIGASRTRALFDLAYKSPFRIGLAVFYSMPSPASDPKWSGVAGLQKLFGARAFGQITAFEKRRVEDLVREFVSGQRGGSVVAFQKDAYLGLRDANASETTVVENGAGWRLWRSRCSACSVKLFRVPPTRYMNAKWYDGFLRWVAELSCSLPG